MNDPDASPGAPRSEDADSDTGATSLVPQVTVSREELHVATEWFKNGRCRIRRQVVSDTRLVEVTVRREVLVVDGVDLGTTDSRGGGRRFFGAATDGPVTSPPGLVDPLVIVLREEVAEVVLRTVPYEQVTARVVTSTGRFDVQADLRHEQIALDRTSAAPGEERRPFSS